MKTEYFLSRGNYMRIIYTAVSGKHHEYSNDSQQLGPITITTEILLKNFRTPSKQMLKTTLAFFTCALLKR